MLFDGIGKSPLMVNLVLPLAAFLLLLFLRIPLAKWFFHPFRKWSEKTGNRWPGEIAAAFTKPVRVLILSLGILAALRMSPVLYHAGILWPTSVRCFRSLLVILAAWGLFRMSDKGELTSLFLVKKLDWDVDEVLLPFLSKALRFLVAAIAVLIIAQEWNYSISGLLAGLGLGGLAFALAAQDLLSNLFGGMVIFLDKPFSLGDWIKTGDVEGTVEDINFRSVKIRTFAQAVVSVPNSKLVGGAITNFSRMGKRKAEVALTLRPDTSADQIRSCVKKLREMFSHNGEIEQDSATVSFDGVGESGYLLTMNFYTKTTDWKEYLKARENIYYSVMKILAEEAISLSFPLQTLAGRK